VTISGSIWQELQESEFRIQEFFESADSEIGTTDFTDFIDEEEEDTGF
jgi:hypothetical protein